jgi:DNA polymerase-3 subunit delta
VPTIDLVPVTLVTGAEELLCERVVGRIVDAARLTDPQVEVVQRSAAELPPGELAALTSPSMFDERKVVVLRGAQDVGEAVRGELLRYAGAPSEQIVLVVLHAGGVKGKKLVDGLSAAGAQVHRVVAVSRPSERVDFVVAEARAWERHLTPGAARQLVDAVGNDLRELAAAIAQLANDTPVGDRLDEEVVARSHRGRAETTGFQIADAVLEGDRGRALTLLRQAREGGTPDVLLVSALASGLRDVTLVRGSDGTSGSVAKQLGMPPWKVEKAQRTARGWSDGGLAASLVAVARADAGVKGEAVDAGWALEGAVLDVLAARGRRR